MNARLRRLVEREIGRARAAGAAGDIDGAWGALERAHVLSQPLAGAHLRVHWAMFALAWRLRDAREIVGQLPRLLLAAPGSLLGRAPRGNTGRSNVGIFTPMAIPEELERLLRGDDAGP